MVSGEGIGVLGAGTFGGRRRILVVAIGDGQLVVSGERFLFAPGSVFLLGEGTGLSVEFGEIGVGHLLELDAAYVEQFLLAYPLGRGLGLFGDLVSLFLPAGQFPVVMERLRILGAEINRGVGFEHLKLLFSLFLLDVVQDKFVLSAGYDPAKRLFVEFSELVERFYFENRSSSFYARRLGVSVKRLNRLCREEWFAGKNCYQVVMDRILSQAEYLLLGTDMEVKAIGFELGFSSGANFATYFVRYKGITPVQFRKGAREKFG